MTIQTDRTLYTFGRFTEDEIARCDTIALSCLNINEKQVSKSRTIFDKFETIYYKESGKDAPGLFVCKDGSVLFAGSMVSKDIHLAALQSGIRTKFEKLWSRKEENSQ